MRWMFLGVLLGCTLGLLASYTGTVLAKRGSTQMQVSVCVLDPVFAKKVRLILAELEEMGWQPRIAEACRTLDQQKEKVRLGYSKTLRSKHLTGRAVDVIDRRFGWHGPASSLKFKFWTDYGTLCRKHGLVWGGDWKSFPDVAHCQMRD